MIKLKIKIPTSINIQDFFGKENENIIAIENAFPTIKIISRGEVIQAQGSEKHLDSFNIVLNKIFEYWEKYRKLTVKDIKNIIKSDLKEKVFISENKEIILHGTNGKSIKTHTVNQSKIVENIDKYDMLFAVGPAGTGKTYTSVALAVKALKEKLVKRIILTRPAVEAGESLGFLPGDFKEKLDPYMQPLYDALQDMIPEEKLEDYLKKNVIQIAPLAFMRGRTLDNAFVILDEAQNTNVLQMKMFLTRMGKNAKFIITGDPQQSDLKSKDSSGLIDSIKRLEKIKEIGFVYLNEKDIIRHKIVTKIIKAYEK